MKRLYIAGTIGIGLFAGSHALAQDATLIIQPEPRFSFLEDLKGMAK